MSLRAAISSVLLFGFATVMAYEDLVYQLPTRNDALFHGKPSAFYTHVNRIFEGVSSKPWEAGSYGFVRNPFRLSNGSLRFTRLHEGIDISPIQRDEQGEPQDAVHPVASGIVVHVNNSPGASNYGRYIVVAHEVPEGTIFSLYAHLAETACRTGQHVTPESQLGRIGYSGKGINKERAHLHLEICLMINLSYHRIAPPSNKHGLYNGFNLVGIDPAELLKASRNGQPISLREHWETLKEHYRVRVPCHGTMDILRRYPFLYKGDWSKRPVSLEMAFTAEGVPIAVYPSTEPTNEPMVVSCKPEPTLQQNCTANRLKNDSRNATLTASGKRYIQTYLSHPGQ